MSRIFSSKLNTAPLTDSGQARSMAAHGSFSQGSLSESLSVPHRISAVAAASPASVALSDGRDELTYRDLDLKTNQLADYLMSLGVGPEVLVGLCIPRSMRFVVAALAVLKAGGAYFPIDPPLPADRLSFMLNDAQIPLLLTHGSQSVPAGQWQVLDLEAVQDQISGATESFELQDVEPGNLAYVIYTSGSTGLAKGVEVTHGSLLNLIDWHRRAFAITSLDRASVVANVGFDASVWELWPYLSIGASLHYPNEETRKAPEQLRDWLVAQRITIGFIPTPLAEQLINLQWPPTTSLRLMLTGGDVLHQYPPSSLPFTVVNNYGPTESTVVATSGIIEAGDRHDVMPPIGRAIDNTHVYILDAQLREVPDDEPGELHIGGVSLARGYRNRPQLTAEKFISGPANNGRSMRLYKTGDVARRLPDGNIVFLGRIDDQIKIRGYRIEPNEIVAALDEHPKVQASIVIAREDQPGQKNLVAYIVPAPGCMPEALELRELLLSKLPNYMVPETFVRLHTVPMNANGKIDRSALPAPDATNSMYGGTFVSPRNGVEKQVAGILANLLNLKSVGADDNFFLLGGHSLLGAQVISRVQNVFGVKLTLINLFERPTVANLAEEIERLIASKTPVPNEQGTVE